jgi:acetyl esterase/lipase
MGILGAVMMIWYVWRCTRDHNGFEEAFGAGWSDQIPPEAARHMAQKRCKWFLKMKTSPELSFEQDIPFWTIPDTDRQLLCDIWRPGDGDISGLAFVYLHGGGWAIGDKDSFTRPLFRHLVAQGHTVMDVSYRLCPEVDIYGVLGDVKRAIAWMKTNAARCGVNPEKIVLGGASAGGHLAQLAGYAPEHPELTPEDVKNADLSVCGVISYYGPTDLLATHRYLDLHKLEGKSSLPAGPNSAMSKRDAGRLDIVMGGCPQRAPEMYRLLSPTNHVHPGCPPTLLIQGRQDLVTPANATCALYTKLVDAGVPAINVVLPWTEHAFDLLLPQINPAAQSALYDVDRFLALLSNKV